MENLRMQNKRQLDSKNYKIGYKNLLKKYQ